MISHSHSPPEQIVVYRLPSTYNQSERLDKKQKNELKVKKEFRHSAGMLANKLAMVKSGRKKRKNRELAKQLRKIFCALEFEIFSRVDPRESDKAFQSKNLVFRIGSDPLDLGTPSSREVIVDRPIEKISLPSNPATGERYIPLTESARITLPINQDSFAKAGGSRNKLLAADAQGTKAVKKGTGKRSHEIETLHDMENRSEIGSSDDRKVRMAHPNRAFSGKRRYVTQAVRGLRR